MMVTALSAKRWLRTILLGMLVLVGIAVAVVFYFFATFDIEAQRGKIRSMISQSLDREVRIDGKLEGEIFTKDTLVIGEGATVQATIHAGLIVISGTVQGNITAEKKIQLHASARLYGNISTPSLSMEEGVMPGPEGERKEPTPADIEDMKKRLAELEKSK